MRLWCDNLWGDAGPSQRGFELHFGFMIPAFLINARGT